MFNVYQIQTYTTDAHRTGFSLTVNWEVWYKGGIPNKDDFFPQWKCFRCSCENMRPEVKQGSMFLYEIIIDLKTPL